MENRRNGNRRRDSRQRSKRVALCGILCGLAIALMYLAGLTGLGTFAGPIIASAVLLPLGEEFGVRTGLTAWGAVSLLSMFLMPDREMALFFVCFGWYGVCVKYLYRIQKKSLRIFARLGIYLVLVFLMYGVLCGLLGIDPEIDTAAVVINTVTLLLGAVCFLLVDVLYTRFIVLWHRRWRKKLMR